MKEQYAVLFLATAAVLFVCAILAGKNKEKIAKSIQRVFIVALFDIAANLVLMYSNSPKVCTWAYCFFFIFTTFLLCSILIFVAHYTGYRVKNKVLRGLFYGLVTVDSVSMLIDPFLNHAFELVEQTANAGEVYYRLNFFWPYRNHLLLCYAISAGIVILLLIKAFRSPRIYHRKYLIIVIILVTELILDAIYVFLGGVVDITIIGYALAAILVYYVAVAYVPASLLSRLMYLVSQETPDAQMLFDMDGRCVHANGSALDLLGLKEPEDLHQEDLFARWYPIKSAENSNDFELLRTELQSGTEYSFKVRFHRLSDEKNRLIGTVWTIIDCTEEMKTLEQERYRATHDPLTGLYNKAYFCEKSAKLLHDNADKEYYMICSDIRNFKLVNDIFGSDEGDALLCRIARAIEAQSRKGEEIYGRLDNDRFALLMPKEYYDETIFVNRPQELEWVKRDFSYRVQIYVGVYKISDPSIPVSVMCDRALMAITKIKGNYANKVAYYDNALRENVLMEQELSNMMGSAIENGEFQIYLQAQVSSKGKATGAEALVRWFHPERGMISPAQFIPVFERNGMIARLDCHIWEMACRQLKRWKEIGREDLYISVNISTRDFYYLNLYDVFTGLTQKYGIKNELLHLEITETAVMTDFEKQQELIERLRTAGFVIEMDDFGSGYSSLNMLKDINVDVLKIDMAFLGTTKYEERGRKILKTIVDLSKMIGVHTITEGVETKEQADFLEEIGCDMFQGYYFSKPMPIAEFESIFM